MALASAKGSREKAVEAARQLFFEQGFQATSLAQIYQRAQINPGSLYYHFRSKDDLLLAVLERYLEMLVPYVMAPAEAAGQGALVRIVALLGGYRHQLVASEFSLGCPIGALSIEVGATNPSAAELIDQNFLAWHRRVQGWLESDGLSATDANELAELALTTMEGAIVLCKARREIGPWDSAIGVLMRQLSRVVVSDQGEGNER